MKNDSVDWVFNQYVRKEQVIESTYGLIICDRSPLDLLSYSLAFGDNLFLETLNKIKKVSWSSGVLILLLASKPNELLRRVKSGGKLDMLSSKKFLNELIIPLEKEFKKIFRQNRSNWVPTDCSLEDATKKVNAILKAPYMPCNINELVKGMPESLEA